MTEPQRGANLMRTIEQLKIRFAMMTIIHYALVGGVALFAVVVVIVVGGDMTFKPDVRNPLMLVLAVLWISSLVAGSIMHKFAVAAVAALVGVDSMIQRYQAFALTRAAVVEGGALLAAVVSLMTRNIMPVVLMIVSLVVLAYFRPTPDEFMKLFAPERGKGEEAGGKR